MSSWRRICRCIGLATLLSLAACGGSLGEEQRLERARQAQAEGDLRSAMIDLKVLLQENPEHAEARFRLGEVSLGSGDAADAANQLRRALGLDWPRADVLPLLAEALLELREFETLLGEIDPSEVEDPAARARVLISRGRAELALGRAEAAEASFNAAIEADGESVAALVSLAEAASSQGNGAAAEAHVRRALEIDPASPMAWQASGTFNLMRSNYRAAQEAFEKALSLGDAEWIAPSHLPALSGLVDVLLAQGKIDEAVDYADKLVSNFPGSLLAQYQRARVALQLGDLDGAEQHAQAILKADQQNAQASLIMAIVHWRRGHLQQADMMAAQAVAAAPDNADARRLRNEISRVISSTQTPLGQAGAGAEQRPDVSPSQIADLENALKLSPDNVEARLDLARAYLLSGQPGKAREHLNAVLALEPGHAAGLAQLAQLDRNAGRLPDAIKRYTDALAQFGERYELLMALAGLHLENADWGPAGDLLERAARADSGALDPLLAQAQLAASRGDLAAAEAYLDRARAMAPADAQVLGASGALALAGQNFKRAIRDLGAALEASPDALGVRYNRAAALLRDGQPDAAKADTVLILQREPGHPGASVLLANIEALAGRNEAALQVLGASLTEHPSNVAVLVARGDLLMRMGRFEPAAESFDLAMRAGISGPLALRAFQSRSAAGRGDEIEPLDRWLNVQAQDVDARLARAQAYDQRGQPARAAEDYQRILELDADNVVALNNLAWNYHVNGDTRAVELAERAHAAAPDSAAVIDTLGWIRVERGELERGVELLRKAARLDGANAEIREHLREAERRLAQR